MTMHQDLEICQVEARHASRRCSSCCWTLFVLLLDVVSPACLTTITCKMVKHEAEKTNPCTLTMHQDLEICQVVALPASGRCSSCCWTLFVLLLDVVPPACLTTITCKMVKQEAEKTDPCKMTMHQDLEICQVEARPAFGRCSSFCWTLFVLLLDVVSPACLTTITC